MISPGTFGIHSWSGTRTLSHLPAYPTFATFAMLSPIATATFLLSALASAANVAPTEPLSIRSEYIDVCNQIKQAISSTSSVHFAGE